MPGKIDFKLNYITNYKKLKIQRSKYQQQTSEIE